MAFDFLEPVSKEFVDFIHTLPPQSLGKKVVFHTETDFPILQNASIAVFGVLDARGSQEHELVHLEEIRKAFYSLYPGNWESTIIDLGDIPQGNEQEDTYYAVSEICAQLIKQDVVPIVLGGSQDITYAMYRSFDQLDQMVNLVAVDNQFDFAKETSKISESFLSKIIVEEPNNLFNYSNLGYQTYFNSQEEIDLIEKLYFDAYRLGEVCNDTTLAEPAMRDADLVSIDMGAVKSGDSVQLFKMKKRPLKYDKIPYLSKYCK